MNSRSQFSGQLLSRLLATALLLLTSLSAGASTSGYVGPPLEPNYVGPVLVHNSQLQYTAADRLNFFTQDWIVKNAPALEPLRPAIDAWASRMAIHPRVLAMVVQDDFRGRKVTGSQDQMNRVLQIAAGLSNTFHADRDNELAASRAIMAVSDALAIELTPQKGLSEPRELLKVAKGAPAPLYGFLQPPWEIGATWEGNGAHGGTGSGTRNSLDFANSFEDWGIDTSSFWLVATQSGTARIWSSCDMAVIHGNGWITDYYHVDNIQVTNFAPIERNDIMANYADNLAQAICTGGASDGPHVHMTMTYDDQRIEVDESNLDFTAFSYKTGIGQFDNNCNRSYYTHYTEGRVCTFERNLLNNASQPGSDSEPGFSKSFAPSTIDLAGVSTLTLTIDNSANASQASSLAFTDVMPSGMTIASPSNASTTCTGGTLTAVAGTDTISLSGASVAAGVSCSVQADVTASVSGSLVNTTGDLTSSLGNSGTASDTLVVDPPPPPEFSKSFAPGTVDYGDNSTLTLTINNSQSLVQASSLSFTDTMPSGMTVASPSNASTTCTGGTLTAVSGSGTVSLSGSSVAAGASCTVQVDVTAGVSGSLANITSDLTSSLGNSGTASDTLEVNAPPPPVFAKTFAPDTINFGGTSTLTFSIDNTASPAQATALAFTDVMPSGMAVASPANASTTCTGGTLTASSGSGTISLSGAAVATASSCVVQVDVTANASGSLVNLSGDLTSSWGNSGTATDTLEVLPPPPPDFSKAFDPGIIDFGGISTLTFTIDNSASAAQASSLSFIDSMPAGMTVASPSNVVSTCAGGTVSAASGSGTVSLGGAAVSANASCTISVDVIASEAGALLNMTGDLTSSLGNSGTASDTLEVNPPPPPAPGFAKAFGPDTVEYGAVSTLTITIDNSGSSVQAASLDFTDTMPTGMVVANPSAAATSCTGGTLTAVSGEGAFGLSGASVAAEASCQVQVNVATTVTGSLVNVTGELTSSLGNSGTATDTLVVNDPIPPGFDKQFGPSTIDVGENSTLTFVIDNTASAAEADDLAFDDQMPSGMTVAAPANASNSCTGGTLTAVSGSGSVSLSGASVASGETCSVQVDVTAQSSGLLANTTGDLTSSLGNSGSASDTLTVNASPTPDFGKAFSPQTIDPGEVSTLTFTVDNTESPEDAALLAFSDLMPAGMTVNLPANASSTCAGGVLVAVAGTDMIELTGGSVGAGESCQVSADITASAPGSLVNVSGDLTSSLGNSGNAFATLVVRNVIDLAIQLSNGVDEVGEGALVDYAVLVTNSGPVDAEDATVSVLATGELADIQWTCEGSGPGADCGAAGSGDIDDTVNVPAGASLSYVLAGTVVPVEGEELTLLGEVSAAAGQDDTNLADNIAEDTDPVTDLLMSSGFELLN